MRILSELSVIRRLELLTRGVLNRLLLFLLCLSGVSLSLVWANGGTPRLTNAEAGPYVVSVWTQPDPPQVGQLHVSIAVMKPPTREVILGANVQLFVEPVTHPGQTTSTQARHEAGANALLYHDTIELSQPGRWQISILIDGPEGPGSTAFFLQVEPPGAINWLKLGSAGILFVLAIGWVFWRRRHRRGTGA